MADDFPAPSFDLPGLVATYEPGPFSVSRAALHMAGCYAARDWMCKSPRGKMVKLAAHDHETAAREAQRATGCKTISRECACMWLPF